MAIKVSNGTKTFEVEESNLAAAEKDGFIPTIRVTNGKVEHDVHPSKVSEAERDGFKPADTRSAGQVVRDSLDVTNWPKNAMAGLQKIDEYTGAPIRKFVTELATGEKLEKAPTGAQQAEKIGVTDTTYGEYFGIPEDIRPYVGGNISPRDVVGFGLEAIQDPFVIGGALVKGGKTIAKAAPKVAEEVTGRSFAKAAQSQSANAAAESTAKAVSSVSTGASSMEQGGTMFTKVAPQSLDELKNWKPSSTAGQMPGFERLKEIEKIVPDIETKPLKYHYDMMSNPKSMKELKLKFENLPTDDAKRIAAYNLELVNESANKINQIAGDLAGGQPKSISDAGYDVIASAKNKYNAEKEALAPVFNEIQARSTNLDSTSAHDLIVGIAENTKIKGLLDQAPDTGRFYLKKNSPRSGISDAEHNLLSRVIDDLNDGMTFKEIQDTREFLRKAVDPSNPGATAEINKVRSYLLGELENLAGSYGADVADTFRSYAKNERARESVEKIIGGKIDTFDQMFAANPDKVVQKIFSNPNYTKVMSDYLGAEKMQEVMASFIQSGIDKAMDSAKGFAPHTFKSWLKTNKSIIESGAPKGTFERLNALADYGYYGRRFLDEVNPSGTAASILKAIEPGNFFQKLKNDGVVAAVAAETAGRVGAAVKQRQAVKTVNEALGTKSPSVSTNLSRLKPSAQGFGSAVNTAKAGQIGQISSRNLAQGAQFSAQNERPKKGPEKWVLDGIDKLNQAGIPAQDLEALRASKQGRDLLIEASDAAPGSKRMESVLRRIRTATAQGGQ